MSELTIENMLKKIHTRGLHVLWSYQVPNPEWKDTEETVDNAEWDFIYTELGNEEFIPQSTHHILTGIRVVWEREVDTPITSTGAGLDGIDPAFKYYIQHQSITPYEIEIQAFAPPVWKEEFATNRRVATLRYRAYFQPSPTLQSELVAAGIIKEPSLAKSMILGVGVSMADIEFIHETVKEFAQKVWNSDYLDVTKVDQDDWVEEFVGLLYEYTLKPKALELIGGGLNE